MSTPVQNNNIKLHQSVTGYLNQVANGRLTVNEKDRIVMTVNEKDGKVMTVAKLLAHEATSAVLTLAGLAEAVVRHALAVVAKLLSVVVPKSYASKLDQNYIRPLFEHARITIAETAEAASKLVTNFMSQEKRTEVHAKIDRATNSIYNSKFLNSAIHFHINGFSVNPNVQRYKDESQKLVRPSVAELNSDQVKNLKNNARLKNFVEEKTEKAKDDIKENCNTKLEVVVNHVDNKTKGFFTRVFEGLESLAY